MAKKITPENIVKGQCKDWLNVGGFFHFPILQGLGAYRGIADTVIVKDGIVLFCEYKAPKGKQSPDQEQFEEDVVSHGGIYLVSKGYEDIEKVYEEVKSKRGGANGF